VLPRGVVSRYLYTAWAVVAAWFLVARAPVGEGRDHAEAYRRQGMYARPDWTAASRYRWRSIGRWQAAFSRRWPALRLGVQSWLLEVRERGRASDLAVLVSVAVAHVECGVNARSDHPPAEVPVLRSN
jgi:hypothetical protein